MMKKMFEFENEVIEEELYNFEEAEVDRLMEERPWLKEYLFKLLFYSILLVRIISRELRYQQ
jgi:hypothetical protein